MEENILRKELAWTLDELEVIQFRLGVISRTIPPEQITTRARSQARELLVQVETLRSRLAKVYEETEQK